MSSPPGASLRMSSADTPAITHVVDDDPSIRRAMRRLLEAHGHRVEVYESAHEFLTRRPEGPGCVLLDLQMPEMSGLELLQQIATHDQPLRVVILSGHADVTAAVRAMKLGAVDLLEKPVEHDRLRATVAAAIARSLDAWTDARERRHINERLAALTPREHEVAWLVSRGFLNKQVAYDLGITEKTVKSHRGNVMRKLGLESVPELLRLLDGSAGAPPATVKPLLEEAARRRAQRAAADDRL